MLIRIGKFLFWLALSTYLGGLLALGAIAAPIIFHTVRHTEAVMLKAPLPLQTPDQLGGEIFGDILRAFSIVEVIALLIMGAAMTILGTAGSVRLRRIEALLLMLLTLVTAYDLAITTPHVWAERTAWRTATTQSATQVATHKANFDALHKRAEFTGKMKVVLLLGLLAVASQVDFRPKEKEKSGNM